MPQKLAMPINRSTLTVMYKSDSPGYAHEWDSGGHFGLDMYGTPNPFYASGAGKVVAKGGALREGVGYWVAIKYDSVYQWNMSNSNLATISSVIVRYFHLASACALNVGQNVTLDTVVGTYGNTGVLNMSAHLHVEVDTDTAYPTYTPTLTKAAGGLQPGTRGAQDTTIDPCFVFFRKSSSPENQTVGYSQSYCDIHGVSEPYINVTKVTRLGAQTF